MVDSEWSLKLTFVVPLLNLVFEAGKDSTNNCLTFYWIDEIFDLSKGAQLFCVLQGIRFGKVYCNDSIKYERFRLILGG